MDNVIAFKQHEEKDPHGVGEAFCMLCNHTWTAVAPIGTVQLECPECHTMKGHFKFEFSPSGGDLVRECTCGNQLFYLTPEGHMCANCGTYQLYD